MKVRPEWGERQIKRGDEGEGGERQGEESGKEGEGEREREEWKIVK